MKKNIKYIVLFMLLTLCLLLCACGQKTNQSRESVTIWCVADEPLTGQLERLEREYNMFVSKDGVPVSLHSFESEEAMAEAFDFVQPDLLLCSHERAFEMYERGLLQDVSQSVKKLNYGELAHYSHSVGSSFFPLGCNTLLLYAREGAFAGESMEELLAQAADYGTKNNAPFLTADDFAALLYGMGLSMDSEFHGLRIKDTSNARYIYAYNLLAEAAFTGGLISVDYPAAALTQAELLPCAIVSSSELTDRPMEGYEILPLPQSSLATENVYLADCLGFAVTSPASRNLEPVAAFLTWLNQTDRLCVAAVNAGLVPPVKIGNRLSANVLQAALLELNRHYGAHLPLPGCDYLENAADFETDFRQAMAFLN